MQYILTQEEYDRLKEKARPRILISDKQLQILCTKIANEMPVKWGWGGPDPKPWTCIRNEENRDWYCDKCPVQTICPNPDKEWSQ